MIVAGQRAPHCVRAIARGKSIDRRAQKEHNNNRYGYNVLDDQYEDMVESGIIDPAKVTRSALQNATSIAAMILTTEALITDLPEKEKPAAPAMPEY